MIVLGLTGSIGMGKSVAAQQLRELGVPVFEADAAVHALYRRADIAMRIAELVPESITPGGVNRAMVAQRVQKQPELLKKLEEILHPEVRQMEIQFIEQNNLQSASIVVLDIPLLYETGQASRCNYVAAVSAPLLIQYWRLLVLRGMSYKKMRFIIGQQIPDLEKRQRADFVVETGLGRAFSRWQWKRVLTIIRSRENIA